MGPTALGGVRRRLYNTLVNRFSSVWGAALGMCLCPLACAQSAKKTPDLQALFSALAGAARGAAARQTQDLPGPFSSWDSMMKAATRSNKAAFNPRRNVTSHHYLRALRLKEAASGDWIGDKFEELDVVVEPKSPAVPEFVLVLDISVSPLEADPGRVVIGVEYFDSDASGALKSGARKASLKEKKDYDALVGEDLQNPKAAVADLFQTTPADPASLQPEWERVRDLWVKGDLSDTNRFP